MNEKRKRRFVPRFSLKVLLLFALVTSLFCGWFAPKLVRSWREKNALEALADLGPMVSFDYQYDPVSGTYDRENTETPGPQFLKRIAGDNLFCHVESLAIDNYGEVDNGLIETVADFRQLKQLTVFGSLDDLSPLAKLKQLRNLTLASLDDFDELAKLPNLEELTVEYSSASNIEGVAKLRNLRSLYISSAGNAKDLTPIGKLAKLESLDLTLNGFEDYSVVGTLPNLKKLNIGHPYGGFEKWEWLGELEAIEELDLSSSRVTEFPSLARLQSLRTLDVTYCSRLNSSLPIVEVKNLENLSIGNGTPMQILDELEQLPELKKLIICRKKSLTAAEVKEFEERIPGVEVSRW